MKISLLILILLMVGYMPENLCAQSAVSGGYVVICVADNGEGGWDMACLDMPLEVAPPPKVKSYSATLWSLWASIFPNITLAASPVLVDHPPGDTIQVEHLSGKIDSVVLFSEFIRYSKTRSLAIKPLMELSPASGVTKFNKIVSTDLSPTIMLSKAPPVTKDSWRRFTLAAADVFQQFIETSHVFTEDEKAIEGFWRSHVPKMLTHEDKKAILISYCPLDGFIIYRCECPDYHGMAQSMLDFFTRP